MESHRTQEIARDGVARVQACDCGNLHVVVGPLAVTLTPEAVLQLASATGAAAQWVMASRRVPLRLSLVPNRPPATQA